MKIKSVFLYLIGISLLIFGNRDLWDELQEDKKKVDSDKKLREEALKNFDKKFTVQKLEYDSVAQKWKNPHHHFQLINVSYVNFKALNKGKITTIESNDDEDASDSN